MTPKKYEKNDNNFTLERENVFFFGVLQKEMLVYVISKNGWFYLWHKTFLSSRRN